ncbi:MAG: rhodanese-like domain-containing protein, partial [Verrucomicrobiota bacterium]
MKTVALLPLFALILSTTPLVPAQDKTPAVAKNQPRAPLNVNPEQAEQILKKQTNVVVLDVRTAKEF